MPLARRFEADLELENVYSEPRCAQARICYLYKLPEQSDAERLIWDAKWAVELVDAQQKPLVVGRKELKDEENQVEVFIVVDNLTQNVILVRPFLRTALVGNTLGGTLQCVPSRSLLRKANWFFRSRRGWRS